MATNYIEKQINRFLRIHTPGIHTVKGIKQSHKETFITFVHSQ